MIAAGIDMDGMMTYQDYLNQCVNMYGVDTPPITEAQWEIMTDIMGTKRAYFPSNVKSAIRCAPTKKKLYATD